MIEFCILPRSKLNSLFCPKMTFGIIRHVLVGLHVLNLLVAAHPCVSSEHQDKINEDRSVLDADFSNEKYLYDKTPTTRGQRLWNQRPEVFVKSENDEGGNNNPGTVAAVKRATTMSTTASSITELSAFPRIHKIENANPPIWLVLSATRHPINQLTYTFASRKMAIVIADAIGRRGDQDVPLSGISDLEVELWIEIKPFSSHRFALKDHMVLDVLNAISGLLRRYGYYEVTAKICVREISDGGDGQIKVVRPYFDGANTTVVV